MKFRNPARTLARLAALGFGLLAAAPGWSQSAGQWKSPETIFAKVCAYCHDKRRAENIGPELMGRQLPVAYITHTARHGRGGMPAFPESVISPAELAALAQMIEKSAAPARAPAQGPH